MNVRLFPNPADLAREAAREARGCLRDALDRQGWAAAILASANSQIQFLDALTAPGEVDWARVTLFHMDEYLGIAADHPASFRNFLRERVERRVAPRRFHYLAGDALEPLSECERYTRLLEAQPIDLCCLGIGENGHLAFNDPPADFDTEEPYIVVTLDEACRRQQVGEGWFPSLADVPQRAISMSIRHILRSHRLVVTVPDERKADAVKCAVEGAVSNRCPASILRTHGDCVMFLDKPAASRLARAAH